MARGGKTVGSKVGVKSEYRMGSKEEIAHRDKVGYQPSGKTFTQLGPTDQGGDMNKVRGSVKSSAFKFSGGV